jgi:hypothetical protein
MPILITGLFAPSGGPGSFDLYAPEDIQAGSVNVVLQAVAGGAFKGGSDPTSPAGEIVAQVKTTTGAPTHSASLGTLCWNSVDQILYINKDGGTGWMAIGAGAGHAIYDETTNLPARPNLRFRGLGVAAWDVAGSGATDVGVGTTCDAIVDSADPSAGYGNVYSTLAAAIAAGHKAIYVRAMGDTADITIAADAAVNRITGKDPQSVVVPVNITSNKAGLLIEYLQFASKTLLLNGVFDVAFACVFTATGKLEIRADDCQPIQCRFVGCTVTCLVLNGTDGTAHRTRIVSNTFIGNSGTNVIEVKGSHTKPHNCLLTSNLFSGNTCTGYLIDFTMSTYGPLGWQIAGNLFSKFDAGCLRIRGSYMNISGNTFDGVTKVAGGTGVQIGIYWAYNNANTYGQNVITGNSFFRCQVPIQFILPGGNPLNTLGVVVADSLFATFDKIYPGCYQVWANNLYIEGTIDGTICAQTIFNGVLVFETSFTNMNWATNQLRNSLTTMSASDLGPRPAYGPCNQNIIAAATQIKADAGLIQLTSNASYTLTYTPALGVTAGYIADGQEVVILNVGTYTITLQDETQLAGTKLRLGAATRALGPRDTLRLVYSATLDKWVEVAFCNNL